MNLNTKIEQTQGTKHSILRPGVVLLFMISLFIASCGGGNSDSTDDGSSTTPGGNGGGTNPNTSFAAMCANSGVFFCDDFESGTANWITEGTVVQLAGAAIAGEGNTIVEMRTYQNSQSAKLLRSFANLDTIYVRFDTRYAPDYDNSGGSHGPALGGSMNPPYGMLGTAGQKPTGFDYFVLNMEPLGTVGTNGEFGFYTYFVNMLPDGAGNYWGNIFRSSQITAPVITPGQWHCVEYSITLNTPGNNTDGSATYWVDGTPHRKVTGIMWRNSSNLRINTLMLDSYNHFNNGARPASSPNRVQFDNLVMSTSPVGCL